jgi:putative chitinase
MNATQLAQATGARIDRATEWLPVIEAAMREFGIDTKARQAMFLAQIGHESGGMRYTTELWGPTPTQSRYEGRPDLGNIHVGDGFRFRGRGLIQTTGFYNYQKTAEALGIDCLNNPDLLAEPTNAARSAAWWWQSHNLNRFADTGDIVGCTKVINGGTNGLEQRKQLYTAAMLAVPEIVAPIAAPQPVGGLFAPIIKIIQLIFKGKS